MVEASSLAALASRFVETELVPWIEMAPGNRMKVIYHDPATDMLTILSKLEPGAVIRSHEHEDLEQTFVLEGSLVDEGANVRRAILSSAARGSFATRRRRPPTAARCSYSSSSPLRGLKKALPSSTLYERYSVLMFSSRINLVNSSD